MHNKILQAISGGGRDINNAPAVIDVVDWLADPGCACYLDRAGDGKASILKSIDTIIDVITWTSS
jgi:hypothetical protein